jgi:hypothetical protein
MKDWIGPSGRLSLPAANNKIQEYLNAQQQEFQLTIYADGPYVLAESHNNLRQSRHVWNSASIENRRSALNAFLSAPVVGSATTKSALRLANISTETTSINTEEKHGSMKLSFDVNEIELSCCAKEILKEIWDKATDLLKSEDSIIKAPGFDGVLVKRFSTSETSKIPPCYLHSSRQVSVRL